MGWNIIRGNHARQPRSIVLQKGGNLRYNKAFIHIIISGNISPNLTRSGYISDIFIYYLFVVQEKYRKTCLQRLHDMF